jgi:hypothetical protein
MSSPNYGLEFSLAWLHDTKTLSKMGSRMQMGGFFFGSTRNPILQHINDKHVDHEYNLPFSDGFEVIINQPT